MYIVYIKTGPLVWWVECLPLARMMSSVKQKAQKRVIG